ncbi:TonB-dependent siderophore receptor [Psychrosphaera haliotis]|uniref:TonB-dependent siderophore receptor n=1 Tax=Psychrosphaera haliotis TaxID=555083 RepID=UPI002EDB59DC
MRTFKISAVFAATILAMSGTAQAFNNSSSNPAGSQVGAESKAQSESTSESQENKAVEKNAASGQIETIQVTGSYIEGYGEEDVNGASRLNLKMVEIPQSVSVISSAQIKDFQLNDINAALDTATGVRVERIETDRTYYTARGFDITNFQIDGIGLPLISGNNHADEDTAIYDRVEVIRGANGLMTGVGNPSATVNFIRKRPTKTTEFDLDLTAGSWGKSRIEADYSTAVTKDVGVRFVAVKQKMTRI